MQLAFTVNPLLPDLTQCDGTRHQEVGGVGGSREGDVPEAFNCAENRRSAWIGLIRTLREFELPAIFSGASNIVWCGERQAYMEEEKQNQEGVKS